MGQKIHPLGFRLVTTQKHRSIWFANFKNYNKLIFEDTLIRNFFAPKIAIAGISKIEIKRDSLGINVKINIFTGRPGILVGNLGIELKLIHKKLILLIGGNKKILVKIIKIMKPNAEANLIGDFMIEQLEKRVTFRRAIGKAIKRINLEENIKGIKIQLSGRLNGIDMARTEWVHEGRVPLQTLRADIDYAEKQAKTIYGIIGIKIWLFKGEILLKNKNYA